MRVNAEVLFKKIESLPPDKITELLDFVDFLCERVHENSLSHMAAKMSEPTFSKVWDNPENEVYNDL